MNKWTSRGLILSATILLTARAYTYTDGPDPGKTGAPGEETCGECHSDFALNPSDMEVLVNGIPESYIPSTLYHVTVQVKKPGQQRWGFEFTAKKLDDSRGGTIIKTDIDNTRFASSPPVTRPQYITHTGPGTDNGLLDAGPIMTFDWQAPNAGGGPITFYVAGNAANGNDEDTGDYIKTIQFTSEEGTVVQPCIGDVTGDKSLDVNDAIGVLKDAAGIQPLTEEQRASADANGDGQVNVADAVKILRIAVGLDTDLPKICQ